MQVIDHSWVRHICMGSFYPLLCLTPTPESVGVKVVSFFTHQKHMPSHQLQTIPITCPFSTWGLDLGGLFKKDKDGFTHIFITVDKFMK
jgi:hypothetical protein